MSASQTKTAYGQSSLGEPYVVYATSQPQYVPITPVSSTIKIIIGVTCILITIISVIMIIMAYSESDAFPYMPMCLIPLMIMTSAWLSLCLICPHRWHPFLGRSVKVPSVQVIIPPNNNTDGKTSYYGYQQQTTVKTAANGSQ